MKKFLFTYLLTVMMTSFAYAGVVCPICKEEGKKSMVFCTDKYCVCTSLQCPETYVYDEDGDFREVKRGFCNQCRCETSCTCSHGHTFDGSKSYESY